jgi:predicted transposase/invertase (TIGR01784 family)
MGNLLSLKNDYVFKQMFTRHQDLLIDLINSVLELQANQAIQEIVVLNPQILPDHIEEKFIILDINATDDAGKHYDIEMQVCQYSYYPKRSLYYLVNLYANQLKAGENYYLLEPVIGIHFIDYIEYSKYDRFHFCFEFRDKTFPGLVYSEDLALHIFELPKIKQNIKCKEEKLKQYEWLHFLKNAHKEGNMQKAYYKNPMIHRAIDMLEILSNDKQIRMEAEFRERALRNKNSELNAARLEGEETGIEKGIEKTAMQLILMEVLADEQISEATGLSINRIKKLRQL